MITREELEKVKYKDFKAKFEELGIGEVFEENKGKKGVILIEKALEKLEAIEAVKKDLPKDVDEDEVKKKAELHLDTKEEREKREAQKKAEQKAVSAKRQKDHYASILEKLDTATLQKAFAQTKANLKNSPQKEAERVLKSKLVAIEDELSKR